MPTYDFTCKLCKGVEEKTILLKNLNNQTHYCSCGGVMQREFPIEAALGYQPFIPYYDEGLGSDVYGRRHRQQIMKQLDVIEAGDRVGGARNFDEHAPHHVKPLPPRGEVYAPPIKSSPDDWDISTE